MRLCRRRQAESESFLEDGNAELPYLFRVLGRLRHELRLVFRIGAHNALDPADHPVAGGLAQTVSHPIREGRQGPFPRRL